MIKELNRSHPSSGSSLGHTVKTVATTARMPISFLMPFDGTSAVIPTLLVQTNACKMHPDAGEKGSVSYAKKIYAKKIYAEKLYAKKKWAMAPKQPSSKMSFDSKFQLTGID